MTIVLFDRECSSCDAVKGVGAEAGNTIFAVLATLLLASILSFMALPSIEPDSANERTESANAINDADAAGKADPDKLLSAGTPELSMANRAFGPVINFRSSGTTRLASDTHSTNCYLHSEAFDSCLEITAHNPGLH